MMSEGLSRFYFSPPQCSVQAFAYGGPLNGSILVPQPIFCFPIIRMVFLNM